MPQHPVVENLHHNLGVLASLVGKSDVELVLGADRAKFEVRPRGQSTNEPSQRSEVYSVTSKEFPEAIVALFQSAYLRMVVGKWLRQSIEDALLGLNAIHTTCGLPSEYDRFTQLIKDVERIKSTIIDIFRGYIYNKYERHIMSKLCQGKLIAGNGLCAGFCIDWLSRKTHPGRVKASYLVSKQNSPKLSDRPPANQPVIDWASSKELSKEFDAVRMTKKITKRIRPLQDAIEEALKGDQQSLNIRGPFSGSAHPQRPKYYDNLTFNYCALGPSRVTVSPQVRPSESEGKEVFDEILDRSKGQVNNLGKSAGGIARSSPIAWMGFSCGFDSGSKDPDPSESRLVEGLVPFLIFIGPQARGEEGHTWALCKTPFGWHFFDPNFGDFEFHDSSEDILGTFAGTLWTYYRMRWDFQIWRLYRAS